MINRFHLTVLLPYRHVGDSILSYRDYFQQLVRDKGPIAAEPQPFGVRAPADLVERTDGEQIDYWIEVAGRWYFEFLASWAKPSSKLWKKPLWIRYEDLITEKVGTAMAISSYLGEQCRASEIGSVIGDLESEQNRAYIKFNRGVAGRWKQEASEKQHARLKEIAQLYPGGEFGLDKASSPPGTSG